jgi:site-specific DNA-methyltransferase (adenine-specific)
MWQAVIGVLKPGAHLLAFGGTRTYHRMVVNIEDAGFEIRDQLVWLYGSGLPKSKDLNDGMGTALKPAMEPIVLARKPLSERNVTANVRKHGTGGLNIDACRIGTDQIRTYHSAFLKYSGQNRRPWHDRHVNHTSKHTGRFPANVLIDEETTTVLDSEPHPTKGGASRFFYCAKASKSEKGDAKHPTIKPLALMRYLCRLVTPSQGRILDPFGGTGTTKEAAHLEGFDCTVIERERKHIADITKRMRKHEV